MRECLELLMGGIERIRAELVNIANPFEHGPPPARPHEQQARHVSLTRVQMQDDFITHYRDKFEDESIQSKADVYRFLNLIRGKDKAQVMEYCKGYQLITQTSLLTDGEKIEWLQAHMNQLIPPFLMYQGMLVHKEDSNTGLILAKTAYEWALKEFEGCGDPSCQSAVVSMMIGCGSQEILAGVQSLEVGDEINRRLANVTIDSTPHWMLSHGMHHIMSSLRA